MPRDQILLNGLRYTIASKDGAVLLRTTSRASQPGDPGSLQMAEWRVDGPDFTSFEEVGPGQSEGYLGRDYGDGTDGRNFGIDVLGPLINTVTLSTFDPAYAASIPSTSTFKPSVNLHLDGAATVTAARAMDVINGPNGIPYGYIIRGSIPAKVNLVDMTLKRSGEKLTAVATTILTTKAANATRELSVGMASTPYRVLTAVAAPNNSDTWATNSGSEIASALGKAPDRIVGLDNVNQRARGNILTSSVTMAAPAWASVATNFTEGEGLTFEGFALDGDTWIVGTSNGPYQLDQHTGDFFPTIEEIGNNSQNTREMKTWFPLGTIIPLHLALRYQKNGRGESFGTEVFKLNTSPVQGHPHGFGAGERWAYATYHNTLTENSYLLACRPRQTGDPHGNPVSWFTLAKFTSLDSQFVRYLDTLNGERTNPTVACGYGSNLAWFTEPLTVRVTDDTGYRYAAAGTTLLTELRRQPGVLKDVEAVEFEVGGTADANKTVTVGVSLDGAAAVSFTAQTSTGFARLLGVSSGVPLSTLQGGRRLKPQIAYATNASTASPTVVGTLRLYYRIRPLTVRVFDMTLYVGDSNSATAEESVDALYALERSTAPVALQDLDRDTIYVRVEDVQSTTVADLGGGQTSSRGTVRAVKVRLTEWQVSA